VSGGADARRVIVLGALSAIGEATARLYAAEGCRLVLAGRNAGRLEEVRADLVARGAAEATAWPVDFVACPDPAGELGRMAASVDGRVDAILLFFGVLGDQATAERDPAEAARIVDANFAAAVPWCLAAAALLERQKAGALAVVTSVAGDRGRRSNYVYGAAKAGLGVLVEGIAHRLAGTGAHAVVVKPGFVDTPMTAHRQPGGPLWAKPATVARDIKRAADRPGRPVVYTPWFWRFVMLAVRNVPAFVFHRTRL
jgi:NAD(P)-dependent dehydrogenase (short-subunit alcohol dehydrogenase family)